MEKTRGIEPGKIMYCKDTQDLSQPHGLYIDVEQEEKKKEKKSEWDEIANLNNQNAKAKGY